MHRGKTARISSVLAACVMAFLSTDASALDPINVVSKVKTSGQSWACVAPPGEACGSSGVVEWAFVPLGFIPQSPTPNISPVAVDPRAHTVEPLSVPNAGCQDFNADGWCDIYFQWTTSSLFDVGTYTYSLDCIFSSDGATAELCTSNTMNLSIFNTPPSASITTAGGTPGIGRALTLNANSSDGDGGSRNHFWRIAQPASHAATLASPNAASTTISFVDERDIGSWRIELDVDDDEGERRTFSTTFDIPNLPPDIAINGATAIDALQPITLTASTTTDPDGGPPLRLQWDIVDSPAGASHGPQSNFAGGPTGGPATITIPTTDRDIGVWHFRLTARDNESAEDSAVVEVTVRNLAPVITLSPAGDQEIDVGQTISFQNTTPDDPDGGTVTHDWELIQAPVAAGAAPGRGFQYGPTLSVPNAAAGTWIFKLHMTDNDGSDNSEVTDTVEVVVDAPVVASITGPERVGVLGSFTIDGSASEDPDSPSGPAPGYGHVSSTGSVHLSQGIIRYQWDLIEVPPEHFPDYVTGPVEYSLGVTNGEPTLDIGPADLRPGSWTFQLHVTDAELNEDWATYTVLVLEPNTPPIPVMQSTIFTLTDAFGVAFGPTAVSAAGSFDLDNLISSGFSAGLGITSYQWQYLLAPPTCFSLPTPPSGASAAEFILYPAGATIPLSCHGGYRLGAAIADDDMPQLTAMGEAIVVIGNCPGEVCLDFPTTSNYVYIEHAAAGTDVTVLYHLNSAIYSNPLFSAGVKLELALFHQDDLVTPVYTGKVDYDVLSATLGGYAAAVWHGYTNAGTRPRPGKYTVRVRATDPLLAAPYSEAIQPEAIWLEVLSTAITPASDTLLSVDKASAGQDALAIHYTVSGHFTAAPSFDEAILHIRSAASPSTILGSINIPAPASGVFNWNGELTAGVQLTPGRYTAEVEIRKAGRSLATSARHSFTAYRIEMQIDGTPAAQKQTPGANLEIGAAARNVTLTLRPDALPGDVVLRSTGNAGSTEIRDGAAILNTDAAAGAALPASAFAVPKTITVKMLTGTAGPTRLEATYTPPAAPVAKAATDFINLNGLDVRVRGQCHDPASAPTTGSFIERNPNPIGAAFEEWKFMMQPVTLEVRPLLSTTNSEVTLEYESGSAATVALYEAGAAHAPVALPHTWTHADFDAVTKRLEVKLLANGVAQGEVVLRLRYRSDGNLITEKRLRLRVGDAPGLAGAPRLVYPEFIYRRVESVGVTAAAAIDPSRYAERIGRKASVYVVPHKTRAAWAADPSLGAPVVAPVIATIGAVGVGTNVSVLGALPAGAYDVVYDFGDCPQDPAAFATDGRLDPGDIVDTIRTDTPSLTVLPDATAMGPYATASAEYGVAGVPAKTHVPAGYDTLAIDFDFRLRGKIVYPNPLPPGTLPLVAIAHGRHMPLTVWDGMAWVTVPASVTSDENYRGYTYLQTFLASHGYVTVSVDLDETFGDMTYGYPDILGTMGIRLRANVLLRNIEAVISDATLAGGVIAGKVDASQVYLLGHSRGAEAVIVAAGLQSGAVPRPPLSPAYAPKTIRGVMSLAPVSGEAVAIPAGLPFLLMYGSADGDVNGATNPAVWPFVHFDRAGGPAYTVYIRGANHNFWNSSWPGDDARPLAPAPAVGADLITLPQQRALAEAYALAFLKAHHQGQGAYAEYFAQPPAVLRPAGLPDNAVVPLLGSVRWPPGASRIVIDDHTLNGANTALASSGATITHTLSALDETLLADTSLGSEADIQNRFFEDTNGALLGWGAPAGYTVTLLAGQRDVRNASLALRMARQPPDGTTVLPDMSFDVTLVDGAGNSSRVPAAVWRLVRGTYPSIVRGNLTTKAAFETFVFPWWAFVANGRALDLGDVREIRVDFAAPAGRVGIDDLEIWR